MINESFELRTIVAERNTPKKTREIVKDSLENAEFDKGTIERIILEIFSNKGLFSYKFHESGNDYLIYGYVKNSNTEFHFYNLSHADKSSDDLRTLKNSTNVLSTLFSIILKEIKEGKSNRPIFLKSPDKKRNNLYMKIAKKTIKEHLEGGYLFDIEEKSFKINTSLNEKSFRDFIYN